MTNSPMRIRHLVVLLGCLAATSSPAVAASRRTPAKAVPAPHAAPVSPAATAASAEPGRASFDSKQSRAARDAVVERQASVAVAPVKKLRAPRPEVVKSATSLPTLAQALQRHPVTPASDDTFLVLSHGFDALGAGCNTRGWQAEDRADRVYAHVSDRYMVNTPVFSWTRPTSTPVFPAPIEGTPISIPQCVASNDSGMIFYAERLSEGARIVAVYPGQNVQRTYANLPTSAAMNRPFPIAYDKATGGLIVSTSFHDTNYGFGRIFRIPAGGGTPVLIAGGGGTTNDAPALSAALDVPEELCTDAAGNIYFSEIDAFRIRMLRHSDNRIVTLAGLGFYHGLDSGDGGPATNAIFAYPRGLTINDAGDSLFVLDGLMRRVRSISLVTGIIDAVPGLQESDFTNNVPGINVFPYNVTRVGADFYFGCFNGVIVKLSPEAVEGLEHVAGKGNSLVDPEDAALGSSLSFGGTILDLCPAPGGGVIFSDQYAALLYRLDAEDEVHVEAGVPIPMLMGDRSLWFGADFTNAPDEVANWVDPYGYGEGWSQRFTSPEFSLADHPNAKLTFDAHAAIATEIGSSLRTNDFDGFFAVRGLQADGTWVQLGMQYIKGSSASNNVLASGQLTGSGNARCEVDLTGAPLASTTRLQIVVQTDRFGSNEDGFGTGGDGALVLDNVLLRDSGGDVLPPLDFEDATIGDWTLSAVNAPYGFSFGIGHSYYRDFPPPETQVGLRSGFDFSDPSCVWTFTSEGDSVRNGTYSRITSPWMALADRLAPFTTTFSGKLATDNQKRYLKVMLRFKDEEMSRPKQIVFARNIYTSGASGGDLASPFLNQFALTYPDDFDPGTEAGLPPADSVQIVLQIEDRLEEQTVDFPAPRVPSRLPYLDQIRVYQLAGDDDHDGVANALDACPTVSSAGQDADGDGCPDPTATLRHIETWQSANRPIHYRISLDGDPAITDGSDLDAIRQAVATWQSVPGAGVPMVEDAPTPQKDADLADGINLITFEDDLAFPPDVIAVTPTTSFTGSAAFDDQVVLPGQIVDSDLIFNSIVAYRTPSTGPVPNSVDLQSVATHEIGHMLGLSHSGVAEATMFPVLQSGDGAASLEDDDRAAIGAAYPSPEFQSQNGTITGIVKRGAPPNLPIPGALVTAWLIDGMNAPVRAVSSDYSDESGEFALYGLAPATYVVRIDPLDGSVGGLVPEAINERVRRIAQTNFHGEWWNVGEDGSEDPEVRTPITIPAGATENIEMFSPRDVTPPTIVSVLPGDGVDSVGIDGRVLINFSEPIDPGTLSNAFALRIQGDTGRLGGSAQILDNNRIFIFTPTDPLEFGTEYEIELTTALTDREGVPLANDVVTHFTTLSTPDVAIFDIQPRRGPPGTLITIRGQGFTPGVVQLRFEADDGDSVILSGGAHVTSNAILTNIDAGYVSGPVRVIVDGQRSNTFNLTVLPAALGMPTANGAPVALSITPSDVAVAPDGSSVFAVGARGFVTVNLDSELPHFREEDVELLEGLERLALMPDGRRAYVTRPELHELVEFDTDPTSTGFGHSHLAIPLPGSPGGVYVTPDGEQAYVSEAQGSRVWVIDVDPTDAQFRGILKELDLPGMMLTGGISVSGQTATAAPNGMRREVAPNRMRLEAAPGRPRAQANPYDQLFLTSTGGIVSYGTNDGSVYFTNEVPAEGTIVTTFDGTYALAPGSGADQTKLLIACQAGCMDTKLATLLGGRIRDVAVAADGAVMVVNSLFSQIAVMDRQGVNMRGAIPTGRNPVAIGMSADGNVAVVANAGDNTLGIYTVEEALSITQFPRSVAMPGDHVTMGAQAGLVSGDVVDLGTGPIVPDRILSGTLSFTVPPLSQRTVSASINTADGRSPAAAMTIVDPIASFTPRFEGTTSVAVPVGGICADRTGRYTQLRVSPDGSTLITLRHMDDCGNNVEAIQLRDRAPQPLYAKIRDIDQGPAGYVQLDAAFTPDGTSLWVAEGENSLNRYDVNPASPTFGQSNVVAGGNGAAYAVAANPFEEQMAAAREPGSGSGGIYYYDPFSGVSLEPFTILTDRIGALAYSPDGRVLVAGGAGRAFFIDVESPARAILTTSPAHAPAINTLSMAVTADGQRAVALFDDNSISVFDLTGAIGDELYHGNPFPEGTTLGQLVTAPNSRGVIAGCTNGPFLYRLDVSGNTPVVAQTTVGLPTFALARTPDGRHLFGSTAASDTLDSLRVYTLTEATELSLISGGDQEALEQDPLPNPVRVRVADALGRPQYGVVVEFALADPTQGALAAGTLVATRYTDVDGQAEILWTMPAAFSGVTLAVRTPGLPIAPLAVHATSSQDPLSALPQIVAFGPPDGTVGIAAGSEVFVRMSQVMDSSSAASSFRLKIGGDQLPGTYHLGDHDHMVFFHPAEPLPYLATCTLEVDAGMLDGQGQGLAQGATSTFTVQAEPSLAIEVIAPPAGVPGTEVTITGEGFGTVPAQNTVLFNGVLASVVSASKRALVARVPALATNGDVTVQVASATSNGKPFVVLDPNANGGAIADTIKTRSQPLALAITPDGQRMYVTSPRTNTVGAIDIRFAHELAVIPVGANPRGIAILPDGSRAYTANYDGGDLTIIGTDPGSASYNQVLGRVKVGKNPVGVVVQRQGPQVLVLNEGDATLSVVDAQRGNSTFDQVIKNVPLPGNGGNLTISPDGTRAFILTSAGVSVIDLSSFVIKNVPLPGNGGSITISPDGGLLYVIGGDNHLYILDVSVGREYRVIKNVPLPGNGGSITISPDGTRIYVTLPDENQVLVFEIKPSNSNGNGTSTAPGDAVTVTLLATLPTGESPAGLASDPFGRFVAVANQGSDDISVIVTNTSTPHVQVESPNGGETLVPGIVTNLVWDTDAIPNGQTADLEVSRDLGQTWEPIATAVANSGTYAWLVTGPSTASGPNPLFTALFRVTVLNLFNVTGNDASDAPFTIYDAATPTLVVTFAAEGRPTGIEVRWRLEDASRAAAVILERAEIVTGPWAPIEAARRIEEGNTVATDASPVPGHTYFYRLVVVEGGARVVLRTLEGTMMPVAEFALQTIRPNPARGATSIEFAVARETSVRLSVLDVAGRRVAMLVDGVRKPGLYRAAWSGDAMGGRAPAGLYFVRYEAAGRTFVRRLVFMR